MSDAAGTRANTTHALHHIGIGRTHHGILIHDQHIRIIAIDTGQLLRVLDTTRDYQPQRKTPPPE